MTDRKFGVEIEFAHKQSHHHEIRTEFRQKFPNWVAKTDSSIRPYGTEINSPILSGEEGLKEVRDVVSYLANNKLIRVNDSCGLHVHVDANDLTPIEIIATAVRYAECEDYFFNKIVKTDRNDNRYCYTNKNENYPVAVESRTPLKMMLGSNQSFRTENNFSKYRKCNIMTKGHGTIEFRHHHATLKADEILNWVRTVTNFVESTRNGLKDFKLSDDTFFTPNNDDYIDAEKKAQFLQQKLPGWDTVSSCTAQIQDLMYYRYRARIVAINKDSFLNDPAVKQYFELIQSIPDLTIVPVEEIIQDYWSLQRTKYIEYTLMYKGRYMQDVLLEGRHNISRNNGIEMIKIVNQLTAKIKSFNLADDLPFETLHFYRKKLVPAKKRVKKKVAEAA